jgi:hypothetical protein
VILCLVSSSSTNSSTTITAATTSSLAIQTALHRTPGRCCNDRG